IVLGVKRLEYRSRSAKHRGLIVIHAGKQWDGKPLGDPLQKFLIGGIIGVAQLVGVKKLMGGRRYAWVLRKPRRLKFIPCKGQLGIWKITGRLRTRILDQL